MITSIVIGAISVPFVYVLTTVLLIPLLALVNRTRGGGGITIPNGAARIKAMVMFGVIVAGYAALNNFIAVHSVEKYMFGSFDYILCAGSSVGFLLWALLGWGEYMDMGTWQRWNSTKPEVKFIDRFINFLANKFPKVFMKREVWDKSKWNTTQARSDLLGMCIRTGLFSIPLFTFYSWYFGNIFIIFLSLILACAGFVYYIYSRVMPDVDYLSRAEIVTGACIWAPAIITMFLMV